MVSKVNASHILVATKEEADSIYKDLQSGFNFGYVAKTKSKCPSAKKEGNLGWFTRGKMVREFENAAFKLKKGEISQPIKTQFGWHIIKVIDVE